MTAYQFVSGARVPSSWDPGRVNSTLEDIRSRYGRVDAETVADDVEADPENHYLADGFTWDAELGMRKLHVMEAGQVIRSLRIVEAAPEQATPVRAWVVTHQVGDGQNQYAPILEVLKDRDKAARLIDQIQQEEDRLTQKRNELIALVRLVVSA